MQPGPHVHLVAVSFFPSTSGAMLGVPAKSFSSSRQSLPLWPIRVSDFNLMVVVMKTLPILDPCG